MPELNDIPDGLVDDAVDAWHDAGDVLLDDRLRAVIAVARRAWLTELFGTPEEIAAREEAARHAAPDDPAELCERARPGHHAAKVRKRIAEQELQPMLDAVELDLETAPDGRAALAGQKYALMDAIRKVRGGSDAQR